MLSMSQVAHRVDMLRRRYAKRDARMGDIASIRKGEWESVAPGLFPEDYPRPLIANFIDVAARDLSEVIAPLPSFNCASASMVSDRARSFADKRTKIAHSFVERSRLGVQMFAGADRYLTYGFMPVYVEPDFEARFPRIMIEDPMGGYPEFDRWGRCTAYAKRFVKEVDELIAEYPEHAAALKGDVYQQQKNATVELWRYCDADQITLYVPERHNLVLAHARNPLKRCPVVVALRPGVDDEQRGQYDDVIWVQLARAKFALLALEAAEKSVQAPIALPQDVQEMAFGPDAVLRTNSPEKIRRVATEIPQAAFAEMQALAGEQRMGSRYPEGRTGELDASVVTGRGVQQLMAGFDTQVKTAQAVFTVCLGEVIELCFRLDEILWPNEKRTIRGTQDGTPYEITYTPSRDIAGDYTCDVSYGMAAGLDPNRALVFFLQLRGDRLVSRDLVRRQMPFPMDVTAEEQRIDIEEMRDALKQSVAGLAAAVPQMAAAGQDPAAIVRALAVVVQRRQKGDPIEDILVEALAPEPEPAPATEVDPLTGEPADPMAAGGGHNHGGGGGLAGPPPGETHGGPPDLQMLLAGLTGKGNPNLSAIVSRRIPA